MTIETFKEYAKTRQALDSEEIRRFMDEMSNEARRVTFRLNASFHTADEVRGLLSDLFGYGFRRRSASSRRSIRTSVRTSP